MAPEGHVAATVVVHCALLSVPEGHVGAELHMAPLKLIPDGQEGLLERVHTPPDKVPEEQEGAALHVVPLNTVLEGHVGLVGTEDLTHWDPLTLYPAGQIPSV